MTNTLNYKLKRFADACLELFGKPVSEADSASYYRGGGSDRARWRQSKRAGCCKLLQRAYHKPFQMHHDVDNGLWWVVSDDGTHIFYVTDTDGYAISKLDGMQYGGVLVSKEIVDKLSFAVPAPDHQYKRRMFEVAGYIYVDPRNPDTKTSTCYLLYTSDIADLLVRKLNWDPDVQVSMPQGKFGPQYSIGSKHFRYLGEAPVDPVKT